MMDCYALALLGLTVGLLISYKLQRKRKLADIPGPGWDLPLLGHLYLLNSQKPHLSLTEMQKKYGDVFQIKMGPNIAVILSGKKTIRLACSKSALLGRPHHLFTAWDKHKRYFAFGHSESALSYRKLTMTGIASFMKEDKFVEVVNEEAKKLVAALCSKMVSLTEHQQQVCMSVGSIMYFICFGEKGQGQNNREFQAVMSSINDIMDFAAQASLADKYKWLTWIPSIWQKYQKFIDAQENLLQHVKCQEKNHEATYTESKMRDLCDMFTRTWKNNKQLESLNTVKDEIGTLQEQTGMLLVAGCETVATSLNWAILMLALHPDIQHKLHQELKHAEIDPLEYTQQLPFMEAFILEVLRFSMASPLAMPHMALCDITVNEYLIPKDTLIMINLWSGSRDARIWGDNADEFLPDRFINSEGKVDKLLAENIVAFGTGRRRCVGEQLARTELFALLSTIIRLCKVETTSKEHVDMWSTKAARNKPPPVPMVFKYRI